MGLKLPIPMADLKFNVPMPYTISVDGELLELTKQKLALARYPDEQTDFGEGNWAQGAKVSCVKQLAEFWRDKYNLGRGREAVRIVHPLTEPKDAADPAFHCIAPSIPGFGFSPAPTKLSKFCYTGWRFWLLYHRSIAIQYPKVVRAQHLNMFPVPPLSLWSASRAYLRWCLSAFTYSEFENKALQVRRNFETDQSGYLEQQKTRPQTLGFALGDSTVGLLAWFVEKFHDWGDVYEAFSDTDIITLVMMHWIQAFGRGMQEADKTFEVDVSVPTGASMYAKEQLHCPRDWADQAANIHYWKEYERGGQFSSLERPDMFVKDLPSFFSSPVVLKSYYCS
ncbi:putative hydrolases or acyltransferase [Talaromyces proteolyticus]|uniref:Hydrolases or acyltransferase n=1 Tax=Talaromyces proteolyticus TaxID=1131652 RepID=A0AAD4KGA6_9EURO|nr:putative hydrolases or acyltransferase [Talaromyces proteolyticus]KAH8690438.1 putative hydrolases or acyltransferase [Talaromyces proteolyticus]